MIRATDRKVVMTQGAGASALVVAAGVAVLLGLVASRRPTLALALAALPLLVALVIAPKTRLVAVVFGALLTLDRSAGVDTGKGMFLAVLVISAGAALLSLGHQGGEPEHLAERRRSAIAALVAISVPLAVSFPVAALNGHDMSTWARDVLPYFMLGVAPILAVDASRAATKQFLERVLVCAGMVSLIGLSVQLAETRDITGLSSGGIAGDDGFVLTAYMLPIAFVIYAFWQAAAPRDQSSPRRTAFWASVAAVGIVMLVVSGTRITLLIVPAVVGMIFLVKEGAAYGRVLAVVPAILLVVGLAYLYAPSAGIDRGIVFERLESIPQAIASPRADGSFSDRAAQASAAWDIAKRSPVAGEGAGLVISWAIPGGRYRQAFTTDASTATLAKFGIVGLVGFALYLYMVIQIARTGSTGPSDWAPLLGLALFLVPYLLLSNPLEDKSLALALMLVLAICLCAKTEGTVPGRALL